jgi:Ferritin-like domain
VPASLSRAGLLRRGAVGGGALLAGASALRLAPAAAAAPSDEDLAYLRLLIGVELLEVDFGRQSLAAKTMSSDAARVVGRILAQDKAHLEGLSSLIAGAGQIPTMADDIDFAYPKGTFDSAESIIELAATLEDVALGAYLGAVGNVQAPLWRRPLGQIAASEALHVGALSAAVGRPVLGRAFTPSLPMDAVSAVLDRYES